jgi:hypothetical protein
MLCWTKIDSQPMREGANMLVPVHALNACTPRFVYQWTVLSLGQRGTCASQQDLVHGGHCSVEGDAVLARIPPECARCKAALLWQDDCCAGRKRRQKPCSNVLQAHEDLSHAAHLPHSVHACESLLCRHLGLDDTPWCAV